MTSPTTPNDSCTALAAEHTLEPAGPSDVSDIAGMLADAFVGYAWTD